jgi:hypothetical protein
MCDIVRLRVCTLISIRKTTIQQFQLIPVVFHRDSLWKQVSSKGSKKPLSDAGGNGHSARAEMV